ncbi:hypothetical protein GJ496_002898 [Pomphorhynchus laevis]|nr:hypothetical protein GJ496_002898 [Pomphorhynchus laevis]
MANSFKLLMFDSKKYDISSFEEKIKDFKCCTVEVHYLPERISAELVSEKAPGFDGICVFVNDNCDEKVIDAIANAKVKMIALRCAGFNNVDVARAVHHGIKVVRVPAYSPYAVAEHSVSLLMTLNRKLHLANSRVKVHNFSLDGLVGFDLYGKTVGIVGTGKIGKCAISIFLGFGCKVLAFDIYEDKNAEKEMGFTYVNLDKLLSESDIVSLYAPLTKDNYHMIGEKSIPKMKKNVYIINTGRGPLIDAEALIVHLKSGHVGGVCLDVYEKEAGLFYNDVSDRPLQDDVLARLLSFNNVLITSHQAYLTNEALDAISGITLDSICAFVSNKKLINEVTEAM